MQRIRRRNLKIDFSDTNKHDFGFSLLLELTRQIIQSHEWILMGARILLENSYIKAINSKVLMSRTVYDL